MSFRLPDGSRISAAHRPSVGHCFPIWSIVIMKLLSLYSLPPSGQKIPLRTIMACRRVARKGVRDSLIGKVRDFLGTKHLLYLSSGRAALWLILKTLSRLGSGKREIILPAYTCPAVVTAVLKAGLKPVLCDNEYSDFGLSMEDLRKKISNNTLAVIVVHLFGYPANVREVIDYCRLSKIWVIEDAAQGFGNSLPDCPEKKLGLLGDAGFFSFGRGKPINILHGGIFVTKSEEMSREARKIYEKLPPSVALPRWKYELTLIGYATFSNPFLYWIPQRIPFFHIGETIFEPDMTVSPGIDMSVSLLSKMLEFTHAEKEIRIRNTQWYARNLEPESLLDPVPCSSFPYLRYPMRIKRREARDRLLAQLTAAGTGAAAYYPCPLNELPGLREVLQDDTEYPNARHLAETLITLPVHGRVKQSHLKEIRSIIDGTAQDNQTSHGAMNASS